MHPLTPGGGCASDNSVYNQVANIPTNAHKEIKMNILSKSIFFACILLIFAGTSASAQNVKIHADLRITLERTMCFGTCPDYKLTIRANGSVLF